MSWSKKEMAFNILKFIPDGSSLNLGIGMPTLIAELAPEKADLVIHSENGVLGVGDRPLQSEVSPTLINAGKETIGINKGASFFDSATSFGMIRGGHIDFCVLGAMEVDSYGSLANWMIPGKKVTGMGGAMDLVNGAKNVFIMTSHFTKSGESKLVKTCTLPLTGKNVSHMVFTDYGIFKPNRGKFECIKLYSDDVRKKLGSDLFT